MYNLRTCQGLNRSECNVIAIGETSDYQPGGSWFNPRPGRELNRSKCNVNVIGKTSYYQPGGLCSISNLVSESVFLNKIVQPTNKLNSHSP